MKPFDVTKPYRCRDQYWSAQAIPGPDGKFYGWLSADGEVEEASWDAFGRRYPDDKYVSEHSRDLLNVNEKIVRWLAIYKNERGSLFGALYSTCEDARASIVHPPIRRTACIRIEFEEGDGL